MRYQFLPPGNSIFALVFCAFVPVTFALAAPVAKQPPVVKPGLSKGPDCIRPACGDGIRLLKFPSDKNYGALLVLPFFNRNEAVQANAVLNARGTVSVPRNKFVIFKPGENFFRKPSVIDSFAPDSFDGIDIRFLSMADDEDLLCDQALNHIARLTGLKVLEVDRSDVTDAGMSALSKLTNLEYISAFLTQIEGHCLKDLVGLQKLQSLSITSVGLKNETLQYLPKLGSLCDLELSRAGLNDEGVKYIGQCVKLTRLRIARNPHITSASAKYLANLKQLDTLDLREAGISAKALEALKGLKLKLFFAPMSSPSPADRELVQKIFPGTSVMYPGKGKENVDEETNTIFGQMSRGRKL